MMEIESGNSFILLAAIASVICLVVAILAIFFGGFEEKVLASLVALVLVLHTAELAFAEKSTNSGGLVETSLFLLELLFAIMVAFLSRKIWPTVVAAIFLVHAFVTIGQFFGISKGVFAYQEIHLILRLSVAMIVLWMMFSGRQKNDRRSA